MVDAGHDIVLISRGDNPEVAEVFGRELEVAGHRPGWDGLWADRSQRQRARLLREAVNEASDFAVLLTQTGPNTHQLRRAWAALERLWGLRLSAVLLPGGPAPDELPEWLRRFGKTVDLRGASSTRDAAKAFAGVLRGESPSVESAAAPISDDVSVSVGRADPGDATTPRNQTPGNGVDRSPLASSDQSPGDDAAVASSSDVEGNGGAEDARQGPAAKPYRKRWYTTDRRSLPKLRQWFAPLPNRPRVAPLRHEDLAQRVPQALPKPVAEQLLEEAIAVMERRDGRIQAAEAKATTLMGAVAIASGLVIAGAGLILDPAKVSDPWRQVLMGLIAGLLFCLLMCGYLASRAVLEVLFISRPQPRAALRRVTRSDESTIILERAIDLFHRAGENLYVADYKLAQVTVAYVWYRLALGIFVLLAVALSVYAVLGSVPPTH